MKRKILEKIFNAKKKFMLCLMLGGLAAMSTGFTDGGEQPVIATNEPAQIEPTSAHEPTTIAVGENGKLKVSEDDELNRMYLELVEDSRNQDLSQLTGEPFGKESSQVAEVSSLEEIQPAEEPAEAIPEGNVVETASGYLPYTEMLDMEATAYLPTDGNGEGLTAMGIPATYGIVAVDPYVIPLGTRVYIPGYGEALAADTGGAIYGHRIDLCMESYDQAMDFGRRTVTVFVLK